jgi:lysyl-tRNA synthetase class 2
MSEYAEGYRNEPEGLSDEMRVRREKLFKLQDEGRDPYHITKYSRTHYSSEVKANFETLENQDVSVAGRIMAIRGHGKAAFVVIQDDRGQLQLYVRIDAVGTEAFADFKTWDVGDIVGAAGYVFKTQTGEITIHVKTITLLSKSLRPLPEKFHGLTDMEQRYRRRYVDLIMNPESRKAFEIRSNFIRLIRRYLDERGYWEVETPVLGTILGGANARPFITHHNTLDIPMYLRIATELHLKRLIVGGMERVYEIGRIFRNEGMDTKHNPEFTTIELYESYADFNTMMQIAEDILSSAAKELRGTYALQWQGKEIDMTPPFARKTMAECVRDVLGIDFMANPDDKWAVEAAKAAGVDMDGVDQTWGQALYECFDQKVENSLVQPTFVTMHPVEVSPLTKRSPSDPRLTERFELFINGCEFANAFSELNDPIDQRLRFQRQAAMKASGDEEATDMDVDFVEALEYGMTPTGGMGIGIDRSVMLLTGMDSIRDVILFPTMKPLDD